MSTKLAFLILLVLVATGCQSTNARGVPAKFIFVLPDYPEAQFIAATDDPAGIAKGHQQLKLPNDQRNLHISGPIAAGNGDHNLAWHWHFVPNEWELVESSIELCDGTPRMVEDDLDYWLNRVQSFCPWSSIVVGELKD